MPRLRWRYVAILLAMMKPPSVGFGTDLTRIRSALTMNTRKVKHFGILALTFIPTLYLRSAARCRLGVWQVSTSLLDYVAQGVLNLRASIPVALLQMARRVGFELAGARPSRVTA